MEQLEKPKLEKPKEGLTLLNLLVNTVLIIGDVIKRFFSIKYNKAIFSLIIIYFFVQIVCICYHWYFQYREKKRKQTEELKIIKQELKKDDPTEYRLRKIEINNDFNGQVKKLRFNQIIYIVITIIISIIFCCSNTTNANAFWHDFINLFVEQDVISNPNESPIETTENDNSDDKKNNDPQVIKAKKGEKWRFILDEPDRNPILSQEIELQVFFEFNEENLEVIILEYITKISNYNFVGIDYNLVVNSDNKKFSSYSQQEDIFKANVQNAKGYIYLDDWYNIAPHSSLLDSIINGRIKLNEVEQNNVYGCYKVWWTLANDYQYYAQEYENQTSNKQAVLYYYSMSIYCCMQAMRYDISQTDYNRTFHYMIMRYHDIYRYESIIPDKYKKQSEKIYNVLKPIDQIRE